MMTIKAKYIWVATVSLAGLLVASILLSVTFGPVEISVAQVVDVLRAALFGASSLGGEAPSAAFHEIILNLRLPRALMAALVGAGLSLGGVAMQAVVRNPIANPYTLGISSGATLGATLAIMLGAFASFGSSGIFVGSFLGALAASFFVFTIAFSGTASGNTVKLILSGMAVNALCTAFSSFVVYVAKNSEGIRNVTFWTMGSLASTSWRSLVLPAVVVVVMAIVFLLQFRNLNLLLMGEDSARTMGVDSVKLRKLYLALTSMLVGVLVASVGTIGFVGLIIPHMVRMFTGSDHRRVTPLSILVGAIFLVWCDVASRMILGAEEMPIGIITSMIGGPVFIWMMLRKSYGFGGR